MRPGWRRRRRGWVLVLGLVLTVSLVVAGLLWAGPQEPEPASPGEPGAPTAAEPEGDPLQRRVLAELDVFANWLEANGVEGYVGEIGIPDDGDPRWLELAERWFQRADEAGLPVAVWSVGEWFGTDYDYAPFVSEDDGPVAVARPTGELLMAQARASDLQLGVNLSGGEFASAGGDERITEFSNENPGVYGVDYQYDGQETFDYLASVGMESIRLPFRWERIQPELGAPLDPEELGRLQYAVARARAAGLTVVLDVHNFGAYHLEEGNGGVRRAIGTSQVSRADFVDLWTRLSEAFAGDSGIAAYDLMNEPVDLPEVDGMTPAQLWEAASQDAVSAIRARGDDTMVMVPGYNWSHASEWTEYHDRPWIDDPADNTRYEAHHYWRLDYGRSYDTEVADAAAKGY
jgi:hypothetical protein